MAIPIAVAVVVHAIPAAAAISVDAVSADVAVLTVAVQTAALIGGFGPFGEEQGFDNVFAEEAAEDGHCCGEGRL